MSTLQITDKNGITVNMEVYPLDQSGNYAAAVVLSDQGGAAKATYWYSGLAFAPVAAPTDIIMIEGGARLARVKRICLQGVATAAGNMPAQLIRRSAVDSGGGTVLSPITAGKADTSDPAPSVTVSTIGTANPGALGAAVGGVLRTGRLQLSASGSGIGITPLTWEFGTRLDKPALLRSTADFLAINLNGAAIPAGGVIDWEVELEEDLS